MENLDITIEEEDGRTIIEVEFDGILYSEEFDKSNEDRQAAARDAVSQLFKQFDEIDNIPKFKVENLRNEIYVKLSEKGHLTKEDIWMLIDASE